MNADRRRIWLLALTCALSLWAFPLRAQGFAGLGSRAEGFAVPRPGVALHFPRDHGAHPDFRIEWWYLTATLETASGQALGVQWTLFRSALAPQETPGWKSPQIWMGHAAVTTKQSHRFAERLARGGIGQAGVSSEPFVAWIDDWEMASADRSLDRLSLRARGQDFSYALALKADGPLVRHGAAGYSVKSAEGQASYYYSQPAYEVAGTLRLDGEPMAVTGTAWLDREWSSQPLSEDQTGWDWFSLQFDSGAKLMGFVLRGDEGEFTSGTWIEADGRPQALAPGELVAKPRHWSEVAGRQIPTRWQVSLPARGVSVEVAALNPQAWMGTRFSYWEGPVEVSGSHSGRGYLEMTGYGEAR